MSVFQVSFWSALSNLVRMAAAFILNKLIAVYVGPSGVALLGQLNGMLSIGSAVATGATSVGVLKYTSEYKKQPDQAGLIVWTGFSIVMILGPLVSLFIVVFDDWVAQKVFGSSQHISVVRAVGWMITGVALFAMGTSILNGQQRLKWFFAFNIVAQLVNFCVSVWLLKEYGLNGLLLGSTITQGVFGLLILPVALKSYGWKLPKFKPPELKSILFKLSQFSLMTIVSAILFPLTQVAIRTFIQDRYGLNQAGLVQGMWFLSQTYFTFITLTLSTYFLPKISEIQNVAEIRKELFYIGKIVLPVTILISAAIYILRKFIVRIVFSNEFTAMEDLFLFQMLGDVLRMVAWLLANVLVARAMAKKYVMAELYFCLMFLGSCLGLLVLMGPVGVALSHFISYLFYLGFLVFCLRSMLFKQKHV